MIESSYALFQKDFDIMALLQYGATASFQGGPIYLQSLSNGNLAVFDDIANGDSQLYTYSNGLVSQTGAPTTFDAGDFKRLADGSYLLYRQSYDLPYGGAEYEVLNPDGSVKVGDTDVADSTGRAITGPSATPTANGGFFMGYTDGASGNSTTTVNFSPPSNGSSANNVPEAGDAGYRLYTPTAAGGYDGGAFDLADTGSFDISANGGTASGQDIAGQQSVDGTATLSNGTVVESYLNQQYYPQAGGGLTSANDVTVRLITAAGPGDPIKVSQEGPPNGSGLDSPDLAEAGEGGIQTVALPNGFAVIWHPRNYVVDPGVFGGYSQSGNNTDIRYFDNAGNPLTDTITLFNRTGGLPLQVSADSLGDGRIALVYEDGTAGDNGTSAGQLKVDVLGALGGSQTVSAITPAPVTGDVQSGWTLASLGNGNIAVGYTDENQGTFLKTYNVDGIAPPPQAPSITGTHATPDTAEASVSPFSGVIVADGNAGATDSLSITLTSGAGTLTGQNGDLTPTGANSYSLAATDPGTLTSELQALQFTPTNAMPGATVISTFQLVDTSSAGTSTTDGSTAVVDTAAPVPVAPDAVSFLPGVTYGRGVFTLTGTASSPAGVRSVEISAQVDGVATDLGAATVNAGGTFTFSDFVGANIQGFITATETDAAGVTASAQADFSLQGGLGPADTRGRQVSYTADGTAETAVDTFKPNGSQTVTVKAPGQTFTSSLHDTFNDGGQPETTFVFDPGFGTDVVNLFRPDNVDHDTLSFSGPDFNDSIAQVLQDSHNEKGGVLITDPVSGDEVKIAGVSKKELTKYVNQDVTFHP